MNLKNTSNKNIK